MVHANGTYGDMGKSEKVSFSISEPFPIMLVAATSRATIAVIAVGLLMYFKKRKHYTEQQSESLSRKLD
jgi:hypothetical protein